jgi:putative SOS response-associated peptidase YedK
MCARYVRSLNPEGIIEEFNDLRLPAVHFPLPPSYNVAPQTTQPVIRVGPESGRPELSLMIWGLVPFWSKSPKTPQPLINARAEGIDSKPAFREPMKSRRCLVPVNLFYEWRKLPRGEKQPYAFALRSGCPFLLAGLWDRWRSSDKVLDTFTIVTTDPNNLVKRLHDRMPCILDRKDYFRWLDSQTAEQLPTDLLRPFPDDQMRSWPVSRAVNNVANDNPKLADEIELPPEQLGLFS